MSLIFHCYFSVSNLSTPRIGAIPGPHLVADPSGEEGHELLGLVALNLPVLNGVTAQEVVQLGGQHGARHLLVPRGLLTCSEKEFVRGERTKCEVQKLRNLLDILTW